MLTPCLPLIDCNIFSTFMTWNLQNLDITPIMHLDSKSAGGEAWEKGSFVTPFTKQVGTSYLKTEVVIFPLNKSNWLKCKKYFIFQNSQFWFIDLCSNGFELQMACKRSFWMTPYNNKDLNPFLKAILPGTKIYVLWST